MRHSCYTSGFLGFDSDCSSLLSQILWGGICNSSSTLASATHVGDLNCYPGSWLLPWPSLCGYLASKWVGRLYLSEIKEKYLFKRNCYSGYCCWEVVFNCFLKKGSKNRIIICFMVVKCWCYSKCLPFIISLSHNSSCVGGRFLSIFYKWKTWISKACVQDHLLSW